MCAAAAVSRFDRFSDPIIVRKLGVTQDLPLENCIEIAQGTLRNLVERNELHTHRPELRDEPELKAKLLHKMTRSDIQGATSTVYIDRMVTGKTEVIKLTAERILNARIEEYLYEPAATKGILTAHQSRKDLGHFIIKIRGYYVLTYDSKGRAIIYYMDRPPRPDEKAIIIATVMKEAKGRELASLIMGDKISYKRLGLEVFPELFLFLELMQARGLAYRDLKPENVFYHARPKAGRPHMKIADLDTFVQGDLRVPRTFGTPFYIAPEIYHKAFHEEEATYDVSKVDVFALGAMIFQELLFPELMEFNYSDSETILWDNAYYQYMSLTGNADKTFLDFLNTFMYRGALKMQNPHAFRLFEVIQFLRTNPDIREFFNCIFAYRVEDRYTAEEAKVIYERIKGRLVAFLSLETEEDTAIRDAEAAARQIEAEAKSS